MENLNTKVMHIVNEHFQPVCVKDGYSNAVYEVNGDSLERVLEEQNRIARITSYFQILVRNLFSLEYRVCFQQSYMKDVPGYVSTWWMCAWMLEMEVLVSFLTVKAKIQCALRYAYVNGAEFCQKTILHSIDTCIYKRHAISVTYNQAHNPGAYLRQVVSTHLRTLRISSTYTQSTQMRTKIFQNKKKYMIFY